MSLARACARRGASLALITVLLIGLAPAAAEAASAEKITQRLYDKVNKARQNNGLRRLKVHTRRLERYSHDHAAKMARRGGIFHATPTSLALEAPAGSLWWSENVGYATDRAGVAKVLHRKLMRSPGHRANILKRGSSHMGIGVVKRDGVVYVVQRFARLR